MRRARDSTGRFHSWREISIDASAASSGDKAFLCAFILLRIAALFIVASALQGHLVSAAAVKHALAEREIIKRSQVVRGTVAEFSGGAHSMGELDFVRECRRRGLPEPERQVPRSGSTGRKRFTDAEFIRPDGRVVMVEVDGIGHMSPDTWLADMARHNELTVSTEALVLRISAWQMRRDPDPFFKNLKRALGLDLGAV